MSLYESRMVVVVPTSVAISLKMREGETNITTSRMKGLQKYLIRESEEAGMRLAAFNQMQKEIDLNMWISPPHRRFPESQVCFRKLRLGEFR
jgi:hypothetical protein